MLCFKACEDRSFSHSLIHLCNRSFQPPSKCQTPCWMGDDKMSKTQSAVPKELCLVAERNIKTKSWVSKINEMNKIYSITFEPLIQTWLGYKYKHYFRWFSRLYCCFVASVKKIWWKIKFNFPNGRKLKANVQIFKYTIRNQTCHGETLFQQTWHF